MIWCWKREITGRLWVWNKKEILFLAVAGKGIFFVKKRLLCINRCFKFLTVSNRLATKVRKAAILAGEKDKILRKF